MDNDWMSDARKIPDDVMNHIRRLAVSAVVEQHYSPGLVADIFHISRSALYRWLYWFKEEGQEALDTKKAPGKPPIITTKIEQWLKRTILHSTPSDYGYDTELWTLNILAALLKKTFNISVYESTIANHLHRIHLSCQVPQYRSERYDQAETDAFLSNKWPKIQLPAENMGADILFEDEAGIGVTTRSGRTWGAVNSPPFVTASDQRGGYNALSAISAQGELYYHIKDQSISSVEYIAFLQDILQNHPRPIILLADHVSFHRSKTVRAFVRDHRRRIRVFFLPKHAPHLNPDEQVWNEIKHRTIGRAAVKNKKDLLERIHDAFLSLKERKDRIISFFKLEDTKYALNTP